MKSIEVVGLGVSLSWKECPVDLFTVYFWDPSSDLMRLPYGRLVLEVICLLLVKIHYSTLFSYLVLFNPPQS